MKQFPRQPENVGGWILDTEYLRELIKILEAKQELGDVIPSWEQIEMVLLAVEEKMNTA